MPNVISPDEHPKKRVTVLDREMAYVEMGTGDPIVFLHGNPTSSYLWRNIMQHLSSIGRCIAPDLIGMGDSDKLDDVDGDTYRFVTHRRYLDAFFEVVGITDRVTLVVHDWGSALGFDWANRHRENVRAIVYMEGIVRPLGDWDEFPEAARPVFQGFRSDAGEDMILERNLFVERVLPGSVIRDMTDAEMTVYRRPYVGDKLSRWPTLTWPRQIPIAGDPADVSEIVAEYSGWLQSTDVPKLFVNAEPGALTTGVLREFCRSFPNQTEVTVSGSHFIQEDSPHEIGSAIADFLQVK
jgi:haloalkane dehalogenase